MTDNTQSGNGQAHPFDPDDIDAASADFVNDKGQLVSTLISPRTFITEEGAAALIVGKPKGWASAPIGSIVGRAIRCEAREANELQKAKGITRQSIWAMGQFEAELPPDPDTGEVRIVVAPNLILPRAAGEMLLTAFADGAESAILDAELTVMATGNVRFPYTYGVVVFGRHSAAQRTIDALKARRVARRQAVLGAPHKVIEGTATPAPADPSTGSGQAGKPS